MVLALLPSSRPAAFLGISALLASALALSGCSTAPKKAAAPTKATVAPSAAAVVTPPVFTATGVPAALAAVIKPLYYGGALPASPSADLVLRKRKPVTATSLIVVKGAVSSWKGVQIAVVTSGSDVTLAVAAPRWKIVGGWWPSVGVAAPTLGGARRVLMVGSDARPGQSVNKSRADSLHIVGVDGRGGGGVLGIARDSYVNLATGGKGKINSALTFGGPVGLQRTVVSATGVPIEGYVITGFEGFKRVIDGIGGLPMKVPVTVIGAGADVTIKAGANHLTGRAALAYGRQRHTVAGGDFGRSANQGRGRLRQAGRPGGAARYPAHRGSQRHDQSECRAGADVRGRHLCHPTEQGPQQSRRRHLRMDGRPSVDCLVRCQRQALFRRHQGWQPFVIVAR